MNQTTSDNAVKTDQEIKLMKISGEICSFALKKVREKIKPGVTCLQLDTIAKDAIEEKGAASSFMTVDDYKWTICTTVNEQVVHGIPTDRELEDGDILGIDIGALYKGFHSDLAITVPVGNVKSETVKFLGAGAKTLTNAIRE